MDSLLMFDTKAAELFAPRQPTLWKCHTHTHTHTHVTHFYHVISSMWIVSLLKLLWLMRVLNPKPMNMDNIICLTQLQNIENKIKVKHKEWGFFYLIPWHPGPQWIFVSWILVDPETIEIQSSPTKFSKSITKNIVSSFFCKDQIRKLIN
jgi:hypothetical protein